MFETATNANQKMRAWTPGTNSDDSFQMWVTKEPFIFHTEFCASDFLNLPRPAIITHYLNEFDNDKNEICEGDILLCDDNCEEFYLTVVGKGGEIQVRDDEADVTLLKWAKNMINNKLIVGNVFENPTIISKYENLCIDCATKYFEQNILLDLIDESKKIDVLESNVSRTNLSDLDKSILKEAYDFLDQNQINWINDFVFSNSQCQDLSISNFPCCKNPAYAVSKTKPVEIYYSEIDDDESSSFYGRMTQTSVSIKLSENRFLSLTQFCYFQYVD